MEFISESPEQTKEFIRQLASKVSGGDTLLMFGDLGSGKTTATKYIADYLGVADQITSPTFVIMKNYKLNESYNGISEIVHMDAYRLHGVPDAESIGLSEIIADSNILLIVEWPENIANILPKERKEIKFEHLGGNRRKISSNF